MADFPAFPKIARLSKPVVLTEKIDGTNGLIYITPATLGAPDGELVELETGWHVVAPGSRSRWITPMNDNHGFARWVYDNAEELVKLGPGHHYGEWWGSGIQRGYGLQKGEKRFSLFNVGRWRDYEITKGDPYEYDASKAQLIPNVPGLRTVPVVTWDDNGTEVGVLHGEAKAALLSLGSMAARKEGLEFDRPEGLMIYWEASGVYMKAPFDDGRAKAARGES